MITPAQLRAARVLLGLRQEDLAAMAGMAIGTINSAEQGSKATRPLTFKLLADVLSERGIEFLPERGDLGPGVRLRLAPPGEGEADEGRPADQPAATLRGRSPATSGSLRGG